MSRFYLLINSAALAGCAIFIYPYRSLVLTTLMLLFPLLDKSWQSPKCNIILSYRQLYIGICIAIFALFLYEMKVDGLQLLAVVLLVALPEEWYFRSYFMTQLKALGMKNLQSNTVTSLLFALLHTPTQGILGLTVFIPSFVFGYVYQRTHDLILVILLHSLSNLFFTNFIKPYLPI